MLASQQQRQCLQLNNNNQQIKCQSTKTTTPTHFTIPQQNQCKKNTNTIANNRQKCKKTLEDKQYRKLNKQSKKVKSLQEEYRELQQQIKEVKQQVQLQLQLINHTMMNSQSYHQQPQQSSSPSNNQSQKANNASPSINNTTTITTKLQSLIKTLFSYQQTIQTANSNYLLLSQVNKQQQSQSLFQVTNLQDRIRQLRFLLNNKQDLLAYQIATIDNNINNQNNNEQSTQGIQQILIDYHMPKKMTMANFHTMQAQYHFVDKVVMQMGKLKQEVKQLENQLKVLESNSSRGDNNKENQQQQQNHISTQQATKHNNISSQQLQYLPLSTTNFRSSLIYKVHKLNQLQQQKNQSLKHQYKQLLNQYHKQQQHKKKLISQYQLNKDIYQYKKKQSLSKLMINDNKQMMNNILQEDQEIINVDNILGEIHQSQQKEQSQIIINSTVVIHVKPISSSITNSTQQQKQSQQQPIIPTVIFNQITNTPQKQQHQNSSANPFLKLKLKSSYQKSSPITSTTNSSPKSYTPSRFSQHKYSNKQNPQNQTNQQPTQINNCLTVKQQEKSFNTPTKKRRLPPMKKQPSTAGSKLSTIIINAQN